MKKLKTLLLIIVALFTCISLTSCQQADTVKHNIQRQADRFNVYRRMTFINLRTDKILYEVKGYFSVQTTYDNTNKIELGILIMTGKDEFKMHYFSVDNNVTYVIEQIENTHTDPYHWEINWYVAIPY